MRPHRRQPTRLLRPWDSPEYWSGLPFPSPMHKVKSKVRLLCHVRLLATLWTAAYQASPSTGFSRQEYCNGVPLPFPPSHLGEKRKDPECDNRVPSHAGTSVLATNLMKEFSECLL